MFYTLLPLHQSSFSSYSFKLIRLPSSPPGGTYKFLLGRVTCRLENGLKKKESFEAIKKQAFQDISANRKIPHCCSVKVFFFFKFELLVVVQRRKWNQIAQGIN